ncbi:MAG: competence protein ComGC [Verrucomicrobiales bacterium]|jgi:competence protein ComGC
MVIDQYRRRNRAAFTLVEMLVSLAITMLILVTGFAICHHTLEVWNGGRQMLEKNAEARVAFDELAADVQTLFVRQTEVEWFTLTYDASIGGADEHKLTQMPWLRFSAMPSGGPSTVSYRMAWQDSIVKEGRFQVFGLYRFTGSISGLFPGEDDRSDDPPRQIADRYWEEQDKKGHLTSPFSLVAMHAVDFDVVVWFRDGGRSRSVPGGTAVRIIGSNVETIPPLAGLEHVSQLEAIGVGITSLSKEGAAQLRAGGVSLAEIVRQHGQHFATKVEVHPGGGGLP